MLYLTSSVANRGSYINAIAVSVSIDFEYVRRTLQNKFNRLLSYV